MSQGDGADKSLGDLATASAREAALSSVMRGGAAPWRDVELSARQSLLRSTCDLAERVGARLLACLERPELLEARAGADLEAERAIRAHLEALTPAWGVRAEEEPELNRVVDAALPFWLVDPNDGTSAFLKGGRGPSVSIALISEGVPVLGVIFAYGAPNGLGDLFAWVEGDQAIKRNGVEVYPQWSERWSDVIALVSNSADRIASAYHESLTTAQGQASYRVAPGVAYRLALCAAGEAELALSLASPRDFDLAAGHALIRGAGGVLLDERGQEVRYNAARPTRLGLSFAGSPRRALDAVKLDWSPTFSALRSPRETPFLSASEVIHCADASRLDRAQGAWWGWHIGYLNERRGEAESHMEMSETAGDLALIAEARAWCRSPEGAPSPRLERFVGLLAEALRPELSPELIGHEPADHELADHELADHGPIDREQGLRWGAMLGRRDLPHRRVSALLSRRHGPMSEWQPDGDRIIEQLLSASPALQRTERDSQNTLEVL